MAWLESIALWTAFAALVGALSAHRAMLAERRKREEYADVSRENSRLVGSLEESLNRLTEMNRLKEDFAASVSHELRTPLTSIQGYVKTLLRPGVEFGEEERRSFLMAIDRQSDRLRSLIEDLLVVSQLESRTAEHQVRMPVSLPMLAAQVVEDLRERASGHKLVFRFPDDLPVISSDERKLRQIVSNLVENALKYSPSGSSVSLSGRTESGAVVFSVEDQGEGIDVALGEKVFERFYQVDQSSTRSVGGTGLGLYICRRLAELVGGEVWLERSDGNGSVFSLRIPVGELPSLAGGAVGGDQPRVVNLTESVS